MAQGVASKCTADRKTGTPPLGTQSNVHGGANTTQYTEHVHKNLSNTSASKVQAWTQCKQRGAKWQLQMTQDSVTHLQQWQDGLVEKAIVRITAETQHGH